MPRNVADTVDIFYVEDMLIGTGTNGGHVTTFQANVPWLSSATKTLRDWLDAEAYDRNELRYGEYILVCYGAETRVRAPQVYTHKVSPVKPDPKPPYVIE